MAPRLSAVSESANGKVSISVVRAARRLVALTYAPLAICCLLLGLSHRKAWRPSSMWLRVCLSHRSAQNSCDSITSTLPTQRTFVK